MRLDKVRDYKLNVEADRAGDEEGILREDTDLNVSGGELLWAAAVGGMPGDGLVPDYPEKHRAELIRRISFMETFLDADGEYLRKSETVLELDESERGLVSYYLGMFITRMVARRVYGVEFLVPFQDIRRQLGEKSVRFGGKRRTDLIGFRRPEGGLYSVWEVRGRSNNSRQALEEGCREAGEILAVCGRKPERAQACMTYYGARCLSARIRKAVPEKNRNGMELDFPPQAYFRAYYETVYRLTSLCYERESVRNQIMMGQDRIEAVIRMPGDRRLAIGMPRELFAALREEDDGALLAAVSRISPGGDGITAVFL